MVKWRLEYLTGKPQAQIDPSQLKAGDTILFKSCTDPRNNGVWMVTVTK